MAQQNNSGNGSAMIGFLAMCFAVVGLVGVFAAFATPLAMHRAVARDATLNEVSVALHGPNPTQAMEALKPRLDESAAAFTPLPADGDAAVAKERQAMWKRFEAESYATEYRMQLMVIIVTVMAAIFGAAILKFAGKRT